MRRKLYAALCIFAAAGAITACGNSFEAAESTVYITKNGTVMGADIEDFNEDYYDEEELKEYITESIEKYVAENGDGSVEIESFKTETSEDGDVVAQLYLEYATYIDYALFNDVQLYTGTFVQAQADHYEFTQEFVAVEDGSLTDRIQAKDFSEEENLKTVIIGEETVVKIDGAIQYVSDGNVEILGKDRVRVHYDIEDEEAQPAYIIYK